ncbi:MAG: hypothetical protein NTY48_00800, partial [Candidatus Diapherotrites archaeon]|nr:hypothetical protein [Candidatus Diapherotrites archaeon]
PLVWMREATQETAELLRENANSIWPRLWFSHGLRPEEATRTVFDEIRTRKRIQAKFESAQELENLIGMVTKASGGFPGWLSIEANEKLIGGVSQETLHRLTAQEVFQSIGKELCEKAAKLGVQRRKMLGEETLAREKAAQAKEQNASESEGGRERQLSEWKRIIDKYGAMGKIGINKKRFSKNSLRNKNAGQERISNYQLVGSSVRFIQLGKDKRKDHFAKIFKWNGREITFNPEGKLFFVQGSFIKKPSPQETPIVRSIEGHGKVDSWEYVFGKQEAIFMKDRRTIASEIHQLSNGAPGVKGPKGKVYRINDEKQLVPVE